MHAALGEHPEQRSEVGRHLVEDAGAHPALGLLEDGVVGREVAGEVAPRDTGPDDVAGRVEGAPEVVLALRGVLADECEVRRSVGPLLVGAVGRVAFHAARLPRRRVHNKL